MKNIVKIWSKNTIEENKIFDNIPIKLKKYVKKWFIKWELYNTKRKEEF